jgi:hypothetical protein
VCLYNLENSWKAFSIFIPEPLQKGGTLMFSFKKLALASMACLAAFAMSCSSDGDDANSISKPVMTEDDGEWRLTGGAVVTSESGIDSVYVGLVDGSSRNIELDEDWLSTIFPVTIPVRGELKEVDIKPYGEAFFFHAINLKTCPAGSKVEAYLLIKGYFKEGSPVEAKSNKITFNCDDAY